MDNELAKQFAEVSGHEFVIEILLSKEKGQSLKVKKFLFNERKLNKFNLD